MWKHFLPEGKRLYGYTPRKGEGLSGKAFYRSYSGRKLKKKGHLKPLVWSGESMALAKIRDVRATRNRATLVQHARGLNRRHPASQVRMNEEIRAIAPNEIREAARFSSGVFKRLVRQVKASKTTRIA